MSDATWDDAQLGGWHINCGVGMSIANKRNGRKCAYDGEVMGKAEASEDTTILEQEESTSGSERGYGGGGSHGRNLAD